MEKTGLKIAALWINASGFTSLLKEEKVMGRKDPLWKLTQV